MQPIDLDEILERCLTPNPPFKEYSDENIKSAMLEFGKLLLERAANNATAININDTHFGGGISARVNKGSITSVINDIKQ